MRNPRAPLTLALVLTVFGATTVSAATAARGGKTAKGTPSKPAANATAVAPAKETSSTVTLSGKVTSSTESIAVSGTVQLTTTTINDPDFGMAPHVFISLDFSGIKAQGVTSGSAYAVSPQQLQLWRPIVANDVLQPTVSFHKPTLSTKQDATIAAGNAVGQLAINLSYDATLAKVSGGGATITDAAPADPAPKPAGATAQ